MMMKDDYMPRVALKSCQNNRPLLQVSTLLSEVLWWRALVGNNWQGAGMLTCTGLFTRAHSLSGVASR